MSGVEAIKRQDERERERERETREEGERFINALESIAKSLERIALPPATITLKESPTSPYPPPPLKWTFTKDTYV